MAKVKKKQKKKAAQEEINMEELIEKQLEQIKDQLTEEEWQMQKEALQDVFTKGRPPRHALGVSTHFMDLLYSFAYNAYQGGKYEDCRATFQMLDFLEPLTPRYLHGLAASLHKLKKYEEAADLYFTLTFVEKDSPVPYFHIADCYEQLKNPGGVLLGLSGAISRCGEESKYAAIKQKCYSMMSKTKKELGIEEEAPTEKEEQSGGLFEQLQEEAKNQSEAP